MNVVITFEDLEEMIRRVVREEFARKRARPNKAKGGFAAAAKLSPEQRHERASNAAKKRWDKQ